MIRWFPTRVERANEHSIVTLTEVTRVSAKASSRRSQRRPRDIPWAVALSRFESQPRSKTRCRANTSTQETDYHSNGSR